MTRESLMRVSPTQRAGSIVVARVAAMAALVAVLLPQMAAAAVCDAEPTGLIPLTELGTDIHDGAMGGLYPGGQNEVPAGHLALGLEAAEAIVPRDLTGDPDPVDGRVVLISIGVSNTQLEFGAFAEMVEASAGVDPSVVLVNGGQFGRAMDQWASRSSHTTWDTLDGRLVEAGVTPHQVQAAWIMLPSRSRGPSTLQEARDSRDHMVSVLQIARERYPNLAIAYLSSREYGGYIADSRSEPNAYLHGFEVKFLIEAQVDGAPGLDSDPSDGTPPVPWIAWGPYLWADGTNPREDGLSWQCSDFRDDGVHPAEGAQLKVAALLLDHFSTDPTATTWFLGSSDGSVSPPVSSSVPSSPSSSSGHPDTTRPRVDHQDADRERPPGGGGQAERGSAAEVAGNRLERGAWAGDVEWAEFTAGAVLGAVAGAAIVRVSGRRRT